MKKLILSTLIATTLFAATTQASMTKNPDKESWIQDHNSKLIYAKDGRVWQFTGITKQGNDCSKMDFYGYQTVKHDANFTFTGNVLDASCDHIEQVGQDEQKTYEKLLFELEESPVKKSFRFTQ